MKRALSLLTAAIVAGLPAAAHAQCAAPGASFDVQTNYFAFARINGSMFNFSCLITSASDGTYHLSYSNDATALASYTSSGRTMRAFLSNFSVTFDPAGVTGAADAGDASISYSIATRTMITPDNVADPVFDFAFAFGMPVASRVYATASSSEGFSVTNSNRRTVEGAMRTPSGSFAPMATPASYPTALFGASGVMSRQDHYNTMLFNGVTKSDVTTGTAACQLPDPNATGSSRSQACNDATNVMNEHVSLHEMGVLVQYRQYGVLRTSTNGTATITATPEPATLALFGTGLLLVGGTAARRRRSA